MTADRRALVLAAFADVLPQLRITDNGLDREQNSYGTVVVTADLVAEVKTYTAEGHTPEEMLLHRLACLTGDLLTTAVLPPDPQIVRDWLIARAELVELRLRSQ